MTSERLPLAPFAAAAATALGLWLVLYLLYAAAVWGPDFAARQLPYLLMGGVLFGVPIVLGLVLLLGLPAWWILRASGRLSLAAALAVGAALAIVGHATIGRALGEPEVGFVPLVVVVPAGLAAAAAWWWTWSRPPAEPGRGRGTI